MTLVQLSFAKLEDKRVDRAATPTFELELEDHQRIVGVEHHWTIDSARRETVDHHALVWIESRL